MKKIIFPLLALIAIVILYAYMRSQIYDFTEKDLKVIHDIDRIALQFVAEKRIKTNSFIEQFKNYLETNDKNNPSVNALQRTKQIQTLSSDLLEKSNEIRSQWLQNPEEKPTELLFKFATAQEEYLSKLKSIANIESETILAPIFEEPFNKEEKPKQINAQEFSIYFQNLPLSVRLYALTSISATVANREAETIFYISQRVGYPIFEIDNLVGIILPEQIILSEGDTYQAKMKLLSTSSHTKPQFQMQEENSYQDFKSESKDGTINLSFTAEADEFDERGLAIRTWKADVKVLLPNGKDTTISIEEKYIVRKSRNGASSVPTATEINPDETPVQYEEPSNVE